MVGGSLKRSRPWSRSKIFTFSPSAMDRSHDLFMNGVVVAWGAERQYEGCLVAVRVRLVA